MRSRSSATLPWELKGLDLEVAEGDGVVVVLQEDAPFWRLAPCAAFKELRLVPFRQLEGRAELLVAARVLQHLHAVEPVLDMLAF